MVSRRGRAVQEPDFARAQEYAYARLASELSPLLTYHSFWHSRTEVLEAALRLARAEAVASPDLALLRTAVAFHDLGFVEQATGHELIGMRIAGAVLPEHGFSQAQISVIQGLILATRVPQTPRTPLEQVMADADLDVLGRPDFFQRGADLRQEQAALGRPAGDLEWNRGQLQFLDAHHYFTAAARALRDAQKARNRTELVARLAVVRAAEQV